MWSWQSDENPDLVSLLRGPLPQTGWTELVEGVLTSGVVHKLVCLSAGLSIARTLCSSQQASSRPDDERVLRLVEDWLDDPTDEAFEAICAGLFGEPDDAEVSPKFDCHDVVWWAARISTASVLVPEATWALESLILNARDAMSHARIRDAALAGILARCDQLP